MSEDTPGRADTARGPAVPVAADRVATGRPPVDVLAIRETILMVTDHRAALPSSLHIHALTGRLCEHIGVLLGELAERDSGEFDQRVIMREAESGYDVVQRPHDVGLKWPRLVGRAGALRGCDGAKWPHLGSCGETFSVVSGWGGAVDVFVQARVV
ncbi:hypothetical protein SRB5_53130 [Streptomyces sp. RB5]|uniref:Uncharacterized protein n=1 Tax=Streptomyces smaragdinus TaxID=2585196 RepID=A0A7K0CNS4_9ACTN|nr:hypothetical protein [Streptomyces smaragdinus]MQY15135.1 hypothetical protein [Streptomyces smaragdinus]